MRFKKSYGQVFLKDKSYVHKILRQIDCHGQALLEVGPGSGVMTRELIRRCRRLVCVEKDASLARLLRQRFDEKNATIIEGDILHFDLSSLGERMIVFGNIPYNISNRLLQHLIAYRQHIRRVYLTVQKEFARKISAPVNTKEYSFLSCYYGYYGKFRILFDIPRRAFYPPPKVDSSFVIFEFFGQRHMAAENEEFLFMLIKKAFSSRRKKLGNSLKGFRERFALSAAFSDAGISADCRPQQLSLADYIRLAHALLITKSPRH